MEYWYFDKRIAEFRYSQLNSGVGLLGLIPQEKKNITHIFIEFNAD